MNRLTYYLAEIEKELELYQDMMESLPQSMFLMDKNKRIIGIFNATAETLAGISIEEIVGKSILVYANDPDSPFYQACTMLNSTFDPVFKTGHPLTFQYMILDSYLEARITKLPGERVLSQVRDITDIVLKQQEVERSKHKELSMALMAGGLTSWSYDVEKDQFCSIQIGDVEEKQINLQDLLAIILPDYRQVAIDMFNDILHKKKELMRITVPVRYQDGVLRWMEVHAIPHGYNSEGEVTLIIGSQKDISQEYEHKEKLKRLVLQNELILNNTDSGFVYLDSNLKVEWENVSNVFADTEVFNLFHADAAGATLPLFLFCMDIANQVLKTKDKIIKKFDTELGMTLEIIAQPILNDEEVVEGIVLRIDDITLKEEIVSELALAKDKAEESDRLKSAFLANMSHEIRTPLNSIVGFSQLVPIAETEEEQKQYIEIVNRNSDVLLNLINDILDLSKIEAGSFSYHNAMFNLTELFDELGLVFSRKLSSDIMLVKDVPADEYYVNLDRARVMQVVSNFMTNAIKFTKQGHIKIGYEGMPDGVKVFVEDTGCGMKEEDVKHVFERFEKLDSFEQGAGLGTSIAKAIVDAYGGDIGVESQLGKGSTFWAYLPLQQ